VKEIEVLSEERLGSLLKATLERPFSITNELRLAILVRRGSGALRKENMVAKIQPKGVGRSLEMKKMDQH
jgi:hypothetical protein